MSSASASSASSASSSRSASSSEIMIAGIPGTLPDLKGITLVNRFLLHKLLGVGSYGVVYLAGDINTDALYAIKIMHKADPESDPRRHRRQIREIELHQQVSDHPNIVTLHEVIDDDEYLYLILDYAEEGDLVTCLKKFALEDEFIKQVFLQLLDAVQHCHDNGVYHRDLKPENILLRDGRCLLADFGLATNMSRSAGVPCGSRQYIPPESFYKVKRNSCQEISHIQSDIWALGIILCNLITGMSIWASAEPSNENFACFAKNSRSIKNCFRLSEEAHQVLRKMLAVNPSDRQPLHVIRQEVVLLTTFYKDKEEEIVTKPRRPLTATCTLSISPPTSVPSSRSPSVESSISHPSVSTATSSSSVESEQGPITPETKPTFPPNQVPEMDRGKGEDMGESMFGSLYRAFVKVASGTRLKLDEFLDGLSLSSFDGHEIELVIP